MEPSPSPATFPPAAGGDSADSGSWTGNIQYLLNISCIGLFVCVFLFLFVKVRYDHQRIPGSPVSKLLAVWHATSRDIACHCGADAAQFLIFEGGSFAILFIISLISLFVILPVNLCAGSMVLGDKFSNTLITHIPKGSNLLWIHFLFAAVIVFLVHFGMIAVEERLKITRFREGNAISNDPNTGSSAIFTIMVSGLPKSLGNDRNTLKEYFQHRYPGKVYRVILPMDLSALDDLASELVKIRDELAWLEARLSSKELPGESEEELASSSSIIFKLIAFSSMRTKRFSKRVMEFCGYSDERKVVKLREMRSELENNLKFFKEGIAPGAGVAFVVFRDVYTANKAIQDFRNEKTKRFGKFFSVVELRLQRNEWKVDRAPLATDIYWNHLGSTKWSLRLRRSIVNTCLLLMLLFFSSPLALVNALTGAGRIIDAEAVDSAQSWLDWVQTSSWLASIVFQFLPNVIIFVSMYIVIPSALSYLSKFEKHLTVSGEQRAALLKMVCFFLVNIIILKAIVESSLETAILKMGRCYLDGEDCKRIEQYMSPSFLSRSCLSALAFLITSTFLGISFDLLAPIPWIKATFGKFGKNDMVQLVPEQSEEYPMDSLRQHLISNENSSTRASPIPKQKFDFAQYYAFNLTIFALTLVYSAFAPMVAPVGAVYFGYRYVVDKYNFLFVYRVRGFPAGNDGRLMDVVLGVMRFCVDLFMVSMSLFFWVRGDARKVEALLSAVLLLIYKMLPSSDRNYAGLLEGAHTITAIAHGPLDYDLFSLPMFHWDTLSSSS